MKLTGNAKDVLDALRRMANQYPHLSIEELIHFYEEDTDAITNDKLQREVDDLKKRVKMLEILTRRY